MGDNEDAASQFEPVGQWYNAITPDEIFTSAHELTATRFRQLFNVEEVSSTLEKLLGESTGHVTTNSELPSDWTKRVRLALENTNIDERHMNAILQEALKEAPGVKGLPVTTLKKKKIVKERYIRNLFDDFYNDECYKGMDKMNGLPITLQSQPDFAVWADGMGITCEGKHADKYDLHGAIRRCASYMLVHLFYWLATKSKLVESVYGVAVAGANCKDMTGRKSFAVVLMRMSLPAAIGGKLRIYKYAISDENSLADLWTFVNFVCEKKPDASSDLRVGRGRPACLQMPFELLQSDPEGWRMAENGTANLVVRIDEERGWAAIEQHLHAPALDELKRHLLTTGKMSEYPMYFKSKNYLATNEPNRLEFYTSVMGNELESLIDIRDNYLVVPCVTGSGVYILMSNMGVPFRADGIDGGLRGFATAFLLFTNRVVDCQKDSRLVHGDIHMGNLLIDKKQRLRLIDYDDARSEELTVRTPRNDYQKRVYNERLANDLVQFTKNQLMQLFWECWVVVRESSGAGSEADIHITALMGEFHNYFLPEQSLNADIVDDVYERFVTGLGQISEGELVAGVS